MSRSWRCGLEGQEMKFRREVKTELATCDIAHQAFGQEFKKLFNPLLSVIPWRSLPSLLIKWKVTIHNCPSHAFLNLIHYGGDYYKVEQWHVLYDAVGGTAPAQKYVEY